MRIPVDINLLRSQDYDAALRAACHELSLLGVHNYIHYTTPREVEFFDPPRRMIPTVNFAKGAIELRELIPNQ